MGNGVVIYTMDKYGRVVGKLHDALVSTEDNLRVGNLHQKKTLNNGYPYISEKNNM